MRSAVTYSRDEVFVTQIYASVFQSTSPRLSHTPEQIPKGVRIAFQFVRYRLEALRIHDLLKAPSQLAFIPTIGRFLMAGRGFLQVAQRFNLKVEKMEAIFRSRFSGFVYG